MNNCDACKVLLAGLLDNELTPEETIHVNEHLIRCAKCRNDYEELRVTGEKLESLSFIEITDATTRSLWKAPYSRLMSNVGLIMIFGGFLVLAGYAGFLFFTQGKEAVLMKISAAWMIVGSALLIGNVVLDRIRSYRVDSYKEIER